MKQSLGVFEVKTRLSEIIEQMLLDGQPVTVTRRGEPVAEIVPYKEPAPETRLSWEEALRLLSEVQRELKPITMDEIQSQVAEGRDRWPAL